MFNSSKMMMQYQYDLNKALADENRNWQERMSNSAHQREIADLKASGLNPVLSVTGGQGANTPSGSTASVSDGAGYASALANLEAARINSATQIFTHTRPSGNSVLGQVSYIADLLGIPLSDVLGAFGKESGLSDSSQSMFNRLISPFEKGFISFGPYYDKYRSSRDLKSLKSDDVFDYLASHATRFRNHSEDFVDDKISAQQYHQRNFKDNNLFAALAYLYPEEYKEIYGDYPSSRLENNRRLKAAKRKRK